MAITSIGYDGSINEAQWAELIPLAGSAQYGVAGNNDWKVTASTSLDRGVNIATGKGWGHGVLDTSDAVASLQGATVSSGSRWDMVVARRNWAGVGGSTTFALVTGSSMKVLPARSNTPGNLDEQPIALVQFTAGSTAATAIVDLRCWSRNGGMVAKDTLVLNYLLELGTQIKVNGVMWTCVHDVSGAPMWSRGVGDGQISLLGTSNQLDGGALAAGQGFLVQSGTVVTQTDNSGFARITFPSPFPNGLLSVILTNGDSSIDRAIGTTLTMSVAGAPWHCGTKNDCVYWVARSNGAPATNQLHRVNYIAIGW